MHRSPWPAGPQLGREDTGPGLGTWQDPLLEYLPRQGKPRTLHQPVSACPSFSTLESKQLAFTHYERNTEFSTFPKPCFYLHWLSKRVSSGRYNVPIL